MVKVVSDNDLLKSEQIAIHPDSNLATVWLAVAGLVKIIKGLDNEPMFIDM